ncbi:Uma2 family endonuclease [Microlunatus sp. GCM10028923]|uniref:Uma2 family endonuclease n=1 Tax=Microlunatus sp. GCM10028923 TaxID=3273400 RepID=UPI00361B9955
MSEAKPEEAVPGLQRKRMSYEEWWALPSKPKTEWVDGEVVVNSPASYPHQKASFRLTALLDASLAELQVVQEVGVQLPNNRVRVPDISVIRRPPEQFLVSEPPVLVVEILSPSTRGEDTVRKSGEYAGAGIEQYWILDPELRALDLYANSGSGWTPLLHLDDREPRGSAGVGGSRVELDLNNLLGERA